MMQPTQTLIFWFRCKKFGQFESWIGTSLALSEPDCGIEMAQRSERVCINAAHVQQSHASRGQRVESFPFSVPLYTYNPAPVVAGLQQGRQGERGRFTLVCRDSAGEQLTRGGEHVLVSIAHKEKEKW